MFWCLIALFSNALWFKVSERCTKTTRCPKGPMLLYKHLLDRYFILWNQIMRNQSLNQPTNQSINKSINQSVNQSFKILFAVGKSIVTEK